jgi:hypothetical protein
MKLDKEQFEAWLASPLTRALKQSHQTEIDALAADSDKAHQLLREAENEMRYAGWGKYENDNPQRFELFKSIEVFLK